MAKIDVTIPDDIKEFLRELSQDSGQSLSEVAADCIKLGLVDYLELRNKMNIYHKTTHERREREKGLPQTTKKQSAKKQNTLPEKNTNQATEE